MYVPVYLMGTQSAVSRRGIATENTWKHQVLSWATNSCVFLGSCVSSEVLSKQPYSCLTHPDSQKNGVENSMGAGFN